MPNITLRVDEEIVQKVRMIALEKNTTLTAMVRNYLAEVAERDRYRKKEAAQAFQESVRRLKRDMGPRRWKREDLYDR